jgi:hypothetical protein
VNLTEIDMQGGFWVLAGTARSQACQHAPASPSLSARYALRAPLVSTPPSLRSAASQHFSLFCSGALSASYRDQGSRWVSLPALRWGVDGRRWRRGIDAWVSVAEM